MTFTQKHLTAAILSALASPTFADTQKHHFEISAQPLGSALQTFAAQSGDPLLYAEQTASGKHSPRLSGNYTTREAAALLLADSGLEHQVAADGTVTVKPGTKPGIQPSQKTEDVTLAPMKVTADAVDEVEEKNSPYNKDYSITNATTATKTSIPLMQIPMNIQVVSKAILEDQQDIRIEDALIRNVSGVQRNNNTGGGDLYENFNIRGFGTNSNIYRNGLRRYQNYFDPSNIEQLEVLKGPSAVLYGRVEPGGMVNITTKKALDTPYYALQQQVGSFNQYRSTLDATGSINQDHSLKYRLNMAYQDIGSFKDFVQSDRVFIAPKLNWKPNDRFEANVELEYKHENRVNDTGIPAIGTRPAPIPNDRYLGDAAKGPKMDSHLVAFDWEFKFNDNWKIKNRYHWDNWDMQYFDTIPGGMQTNNQLLNRTLITGPANGQVHATNLDLIGQFELLGSRHDVLIGGDFFRNDFKMWDERFTSNTKGVVPAIDIFNPTYGLVTQAAIDTLPYDWQLTRKEEWFGVYFQDQITLWDKLHILGGGRYDWATYGQATGTTFSQAEAKLGAGSYENEKFSPRVGILYQPLQWLSLYGNYTESLGSQNGILASGEVNKPQSGEQFEAGFKTEWFDQRLSSTVAFYHLTKSNLLTADPLVPSRQIAIGEARSQGIEVDIKGQLTEKLNLVTTYAYTDTRVTKDNGALLGKRLPSVPEHQASLWGTYQFTERFKVGLGGVAVGQVQGDATNSYQLPGYVRMDAMAAYMQPIGKSKLTAQINVNNLLDKEYYSGSGGRNFILTGAPLSVMGSLKLEF